MATCPECDAALDIEAEDVDLEERLSCDECGASLKVSSIAPLELEPDDEDEDDEEDDDFDDDEDDEEDVEEEEEEESGTWEEEE